MTEKKERNKKSWKLVQSDSWFPGSVCHVRYAGGSPEYVYMNTSDPERALRKEIRRMGWLAAIAVIVFLYFLLSSSTLFSFGAHGVFPEKLTGTEDLEIVVDDPYGYLDTAPFGLYDRLVLFEEKTGIVPAVEVCNYVPVFEIPPATFQGAESASASNGLSALGLTARERMRTNVISISQNDDGLWWHTRNEHFNRLDDDGRRLLIVLYVPEESGDWRWEGMCAEAIRTAVSDRLLGRFADTLTSELKENGGEEPGGALVKAFDDILPYCGRTDVRTLSAIILRLLASGGAAAALIGGCVKSRRRLVGLEGLTVLPYNGGNEYGTCTCSECGGTYVAGVHECCPHCGAAAEPAQDEITAAPQA